MEGRPYLVGKDHVVIFSEPRPIVVCKDSWLYPTVVETLRKDPDRVLDVIEEKLEEITKISKEFKGMDMMPGVLRDRAFYLLTQGLPIDPILKFWERLKQNPDESVREQLYSFLESRHVVIDTDGTFLAYKAMSPQFTSLYDPSFQYELGKERRVPREQVDPDPYVPCSRGLHVGSYQYAIKFGGSYSVIVLCRVDPKDVVAVPRDSNTEKCRVCALTPLKVVRGPIGTDVVVPHAKEVPQSFFEGSREFVRVENNEVPKDAWLKLPEKKWPRVVRAFKPKEVFKAFHEGRWYLMIVTDGVYTYKESA